MKTPLVSVIVPLYNYEKYICSCIESIKNQDYNNYELIIADDCSTDNSYEVAKSFEDDKIRVIQMDKNRGYSKAKNDAIILSKGEFITTLDADDMLTKKSISCRVNALISTGYPFVHAKALNVRNNISLDKCYQIKNINHKQPRIHAQTVMMERWVYCKYGLYEENLRSKSDKEMWWRLFGKNDKAKFKIKKLFIDEYVAYYRIHGNSMMDKRGKNPNLQKQLMQQLEDSYAMRQKNINVENTRFLEG